MVSAKTTTKDYQSGYAKGFNAGRERTSEAVKEAERIKAAYWSRLDILEKRVEEIVSLAILEYHAPTTKTETKGEAAYGLMKRISNEVVAAILEQHEKGRNES